LVLGLYLSNHGLKREGEKLLGPRVVTIIDVDEGRPMTTVALLGSSSARPQDDDGAGARGEEGRGHRCRGENEGRERVTVDRLGKK
jgi:hypothetical protein